jgi:hypothetical protein
VTVSASSGDDTSSLSGQITRLGQLEITNVILGYGSSGTVVFLGYFSGRKVAVKRMLLDFLDPLDPNTTLTTTSSNDEHLNHTTSLHSTLPRRALREIELLVQSGLISLFSSSFSCLV